jgi:DNA invertase Pin-like site-specific DNA recombinase
MRTKTRPVPTATVPREPALAYVTDDADRSAIAEACAALGLSIVAVVDGSSDGDRIPVATTLDALASGDASCLVVRRLGDLGGDDDGLARALDRIDADGVRLVALDVGLDTAEPPGREALRRRPRPTTAPWLRAVEKPAAPESEMDTQTETAPAMERQTETVAAPQSEAPATEPTPSLDAEAEAPGAEQTPSAAPDPKTPGAEPTASAAPDPKTPAAQPTPTADPTLTEPPPPLPATPRASRAAMPAVATIGYASAAGSKAGAAAAMSAHREAIERRCAEGDLDLLELVGDREPKDRKVLDRPGLAHALRRIAAGEASCLVTCGLDHLSRSVAELGQLLRWLDRRQTRLIVLDLDLDTATESGRATLRALTSVGDWERDRLSQRTRAGLAAARAKRRAGPGAGAAAERTAAVHERIAAMRADGMTLQAIADVLNDEGVPTQRGGAKWRPSSVQSAAGYKRPARTRASGALPDVPADP